MGISAGLVSELKISDVLTFLTVQGLAAAAQPVAKRALGPGPRASL